MQSYDFQVVLDAPLETVSFIYIDVERWCNRNVFGEIHRAKGEPWTAGSRLQIEIRTPIRATVDQVVQYFTPYESVSYISHVLGITCETRVVSVRVSGGKTSINVSMNLLERCRDLWDLP